MPKYRRKEDRDFVVEVEIVEEEENLYARLTPLRDVVLDVSHELDVVSHTVPLGRDPWSLELPFFVERYEPVHKRDWKLGDKKFREGRQC